MFHENPAGAESPAEPLSLLEDADLRRALRLRPMKAVNHELNPFLAGVELQAKKKRTGTTEINVITDADTGARVGFQQDEITYVDNARFVKIMGGMLAAGAGLGLAGSKVFFLLLDTVITQPGQDEVYLTWNSQMKIADERQVDFSERTMRRGLQALEEARFIAPSGRGKGWFWINPSYFFNGDRVRFVNTIIRKNPDLPESQRPRVRYPEDKKPRETKRAQVGRSEK